MSDIVLTIKGLKKEFMLRHGAASLKTALLWWKRPEMEHLQVLRGIDLELRKGECVALVGRNGAGKSTLLSLISRIYKPTSGSITVGGRIAPLLELGAGFHPDLSGVENIFFNGVILGLTRKEILKRTDAIIDFSELRHHIDAPVRTFSSGMLARLGFAIAVHVDASILIVDEVLAVGDAAFEEKCYRFIEGFIQGGGAVLFVSHQVPSIRRVATRVVWLKEGLIVADGEPETVLAAYQEEMLGSLSVSGPAGTPDGREQHPQE